MVETSNVKQSVKLSNRPGIAAGILSAFALASSLAALAAPPAKPAAKSGKPPATATPGHPNARTPQRVGFNHDIRPILSDTCFTCHGPDSAARKAGLRLDRREEAVAKGIIVPGKPEQSRLITRVFAAQPALLMPPVASHKTLTAEQKSLLKRWIAQGAEYEPHWAFVAPAAKVPVPAVKNAAWPRNEIDRFVLARLEREGLKPSPEATRTDWLRRVTLDLTGIPPTLAEVDAFQADKSPGAYAAVVDRLLASPRYGERMAIPWLDVARYADSYGYQSDQLCPTWPYRDWVVKALNDNLPYDQFITWQIAGDLLPNATRDQRLATAFNRIHRMTNEGGSVPEEWRLEGVSDRVHTFGTAFLGLTFECARCHDHKFDPISQRDYYSLTAFFNSIDEYGMYDRADIVPSPSLLLPTPDQERELTAANAAAKQAEAALAKARTEREPAFRAWSEKRNGVDVLADLVGRFDFERFDGAAVPNLASGAKDQGVRVDAVELVPGHSGKAAQFDGEDNVNFPALGRFTRHTPFTIAFWMYDPRQAAEPAVVYQACSGTDAGPHGYDLLLEKGTLTARMFRHWPGNAIAVRSQTKLAANTWTHVTVTYDGSSRASGLHIYVNGTTNDETVRDHLYKGTGQHTLTFAQRFRDKGFKGGRIDDLFLFNRALTGLEVNRLAAEQSTVLSGAGASDALRDFYFSALDPETRKAADALSAARARVVAAEDAQMEVAVMDEMPKPRPAYLLPRGAYDAPRTDENRVSRVTPSAILPFPANLRKDRLGLAQWLTRPDHPLTARVAVNRTWAQFFGRGIVETVENFGLQGRLPSHPELLDWLARDFINSGWNTKALVKKIVLSSTYRQASATRPDLKERDPDNSLLARGPSYRLNAEAIRDTALAACGLLDERRGGPPVSPYQPGDLWRESNSMSPAYRQSVGTDLYRRSLYSVWKRTAPMPNMLAFDAVSREVCVARRQSTSTPLQALVLLNDPQYVEAARVLATRMLKEGSPDPAQRVRFAFRQLATREPSANELKLLTGLYASQRDLFARSPDEAAKLLKLGETKPDPSLSPTELAAATVVVQTIMNLDATIWKR